jgi:hypothetical protein
MPEEPAGQKSLNYIVRGYGRRLAVRLRYQIETHLQFSPRSFIDEMIAGRPEPKRDPMVQEYQDLFDQTTSRIADIWRGIRFHLEVAVDDLEALATADGREEKEHAGAAGAAGEAVESAQLALAVLAEAERALPASLTPLATFFEAIPDRLTQEHQSFVQSVRQEFESVDSWDKTSRHVLRRLLRTLVDLRDRGQKVIDQGR